MPHLHPHKPVHHIKPNYKRLALIAATAALLTSTTLPGMSAPLAEASASTFASSASSTSQQVAKTNDSSSQINSNYEFSPTTKIKPIIKSLRPKINNIQMNTKPTTQSQHKYQTPQLNKSTTKAQVTTAKPTHEEKSLDKSGIGNAPKHYKEVLDISATAYAPGPHDNEQWGTKTYIGTEVRPGIIAVDPKIIPLGSRVYIQYPNGHGEYAVAEDTGGAIKGNRIDIAKQTVNEAEDFGIQNVKVYVVSHPKNV